MISTTLRAVMICQVCDLDKKINAECIPFCIYFWCRGRDLTRGARCAFWFAARGKCVVNVPQILGILIRARDAIYRVRRYAFAGKTLPPEEFSTRLLLQVPSIRCKNTPTKSQGVFTWCRGRDLNPHVKNTGV